MWAIARVQAGRENRVGSRLVQRGCEIYYPIATVWRRPARARTLKPKQVCAMPGYLFLRRETIGNLEEYRLLEGFYHLLTTAAGEHKFLEEDDIEWMREHMEASEKPSGGALVRFEVGDRVRVGSGPFEGLRASVMGLQRHLVWIAGVDIKFPVLLHAGLLESVDN